MGAPTGSEEVVKATRAWDRTVRPSRIPLMTRVAGVATEWAWMAAQVAAAGVHVQVAACWAVRVGGLLVSLTAWASMGGISMRSPPVTKWMGGVLSAKKMSMFQEAPAASRQRMVGGVMPGGKMEPS